MTKIFTSVIGRKPGPLTAGQTILWWELRRLPFNLLVGFAGVISIAASVLTALFTGSECGIPGSPFFAVVGIVLYGVTANVMYTGGWVVELLLRPHMATQRFAQIAFATGLSVSVLLTLSPAVAIPVVCTIGGGSATVLRHGQFWVE